MSERHLTFKRTRRLFEPPPVIRAPVGPPGDTSLVEMSLHGSIAARTRASRVARGEPVTPAMWRGELVVGGAYVLAALALALLAGVQGASITTYLPNSTSAMQGARPLVANRGVQLDGLLRKGTGRGLAVAGNPFASSAGASSHLGAIDLSTGTCDVFAADLHLPSSGIDWVVGRSLASATSVASRNTT